METYSVVCPECHAAIGAKCMQRKRFGYGYELLPTIHPERQALIENKVKNLVPFS